VLAKALHDAGQLPDLPGREPFAGALTHGAVRLDDRAPNTRFGDVSKPDALLATVGADTLRLALLHAASPGTAFAWNDQPLRHCNNFLKSLYGYAAQRLREWSPPSESRPPEERSDASDAGVGPPEARSDAASDILRRRLARWCRVGCAKVTESLERLEMQRAAHNAMLLFTRIQDFEQRALDRSGGELEPADREAIVAALALLVQLLAPLTPHIAEELWSLSGHTSLVSDSPWPAAAS
jgi:leucyl-tRNA synthetase